MIPITIFTALLMNGTICLSSFDSVRLTIWARDLVATSTNLNKNHRMITVDATLSELITNLFISGCSGRGKIAKLAARPARRSINPNGLLNASKNRLSISIRVFLKTGIIFFSNK